MSKFKTEEEILVEYSQYQKNNEEILKAFRKEGKKQKKYWYLKVKCTKHNYIFDIMCSNYKQGKGCPRCKGSKIKKDKTLDLIQVKKDFQNFLKPNEYLIDVYRDNNRWWGKIKCEKHGIFDIRRNNHKRGEGCPKCKIDTIKQKCTMLSEQVESDFRKQLKPNEKFIKIYQKKNSKNHNVWWATLECIKHGQFDISKGDHKRGNGCQKCNSSKGEEKVREYLYSNNIDFEEQYVFEDCKHRKPLPFDFYISSSNIIIEYQGIQHYKPVDFFGGEKAFKKQQKRDKIKKEYCRKNNISLLEIPYTEYNNIEKILKRELSI